jgi:hypothetical protein
MGGDLRPGIILTVTGIIALVHYVLVRRGAISGLMPPAGELLAAIVLLVLGIPLLVIGALAR